MSPKKTHQMKFKYTLQKNMTTVGQTENACSIGGLVRSSLRKVVGGNFFWIEIDTLVRVVGISFCLLLYTALLVSLETF